MNPPELLEWCFARRVRAWPVGAGRVLKVQPIVQDTPIAGPWVLDLYGEAHEVIRCVRSGEIECQQTGALTAKDLQCQPPGRLLALICAIHGLPFVLIRCPAKLSNLTASTSISCTRRPCHESSDMSDRVSKPTLGCVERWPKRQWSSARPQTRIIWRLAGGYSASCVFRG